MSNYKGHLVGATIAYSAIIWLLALYTEPLPTTIQWFMFIIAGSLFPDIDIKSKGQKYFYQLILLLILICVVFKSYYAAFFLAIFSILPLIVKHRGLFHNFWFLLLLVFGISGFLSRIFPIQTEIIVTDAAFFFLGIVSHLWLDLGFKRMLKFRQ